MNETEQLDMLDTFIELLTSQTGIIPLATHRKSILSYIKKRCKEIAVEDRTLATQENVFREYMSRLLKDENELDALINESTVNETYFFREEPQYDFLRTVVIPQWKEKSYGGRLKIWSAACSSGEEPYSLALLARSLDVVPCVTASDIDTVMLKKCSEGIYDKQKSMRKLDGGKYHSLLAPFVDDDKVKISSEIKSLVTTQRINLKGLESNPILPVAQDVVFLRNVFIYFSTELRKSILQTIVDKVLVTGGYLFVSISEIASIDESVIPKKLQKQNEGKVFYFRKVRR